MTDSPLHPDDRAALVESAKNVALEQWVNQFVLLVQLAVEYHPDEIKAALGHAFDLKAVEDYAARVMAVVNRTEEEARLRADDIGQRLTDLERQATLLETMWAKLNERISQGAKAVNALAKKCQEIARNVGARLVGRGPQK